MKATVYNLSGKATGEVELDDAVFCAEVRPHLFWEVVRWQLARRRAGTHSSKHRCDVSGTNKKPYKQKGTGRARRGTMRSGHHVGGAAQFGPKPRDHSYPLNKRVRREALKSALSLRAGAGAGRGGGLKVIDGWDLDKPRTKAVVEGLAGLQAGKRTLIVDLANDNLHRSARNVPTAKFLPVAGLNVYDLLKHDTLVVTAQALPAIVARLCGAGGAR